MRTRQVSCPGGTLYTIAAGDTLYRLANRYNTTVRAIQDANPGINAQDLQVGQQICIPVPPAPGPCPGGTIYTVRAGDTMSAISRRTGVPLNQLLAANPQVTNPDILSVGQKLCIPGTGAVPCPGGTVYTIVAGDTLYSLARRYNTTVNAIREANPGIDPRSLQVGRRICIPGTGGMVPCPGGTLYTVRSGDTMSAISRRTGVPLNQLLAANPQITNPDVLSVGQQICVPGSR